MNDTITDTTASDHSRRNSRAFRPAIASSTRHTALVQVLGAVAYGEWKAYKGAKAEADAATDETTRRRYRKVAAEELRHHKGFVARLEALGADPERAMRPYRVALDTYHSRTPTDPVDEAVAGYLGEGIADDLLQWLRKVVDSETAAFIDTVIEDEVAHEAAAANDLRAVLGEETDGKRRAANAAQKMVLHLLWSGRRGATPLVAFLRLGRPHELIGALVSGHLRRMSAIGAPVLSVPRPRMPRLAAPPLALRRSHHASD